MRNELPLKVIASFSASRFALPSIPLMVLHSMVTSVFWSRGFNKISIFAFFMRRCSSGCHNSDLEVHARWDLFYGGSSRLVITSNISAETLALRGLHLLSVSVPVSLLQVNIGST